MYWGDNGVVKPASETYDENIKKILGEDKNKTRREVKVLSEEQRKRQAMYPY